MMLKTFPVEWGKGGSFMRYILRKGEKRVVPILLNKEVLRQAQDKIILEIILEGENSSVDVWGLLMAKGESQTAFEVYITHVGARTKSRVIVKSVLRGESTFDFRGNVKIEKGAKGADAYLRSDALLFDDAKMGDDTPALEILERDVKAGHAATIGKVDEIMLFYLMSRGISRKGAEKLLIEGFTRPILDKISDAQ